MVIKKKKEEGSSDIEPFSWKEMWFWAPPACIMLAAGETEVWEISYSLKVFQSNKENQANGTKTRKSVTAELCNTCCKFSRKSRW